MIGAKTSLKTAEKVKAFILENSLMDFERVSKKGKEFIIFPVKKSFENKDAEIVNVDFEKRRKRVSWAKLLKEELSEEEIEHLKTAHDVVGTIAILEIPEELASKEKFIAETLLKTNKNVKTVLKKAAEHEGTFRTQKMKWIAGEKTKETIHIENKTRLKLDVEQVYFSARLATERKRIMLQVKKGEDVLVMFSGCGPYVCTIAKNTEANKVTGVELNPIGHKYAVENLKLNKIRNAVVLEGDVKDVVPGLKETFDRILMPLPKSAEDFLETALKASKKGTIIHFYDFLHETEFEQAEAKVKKECEKAKLKYKILSLTKCGQYSPGKFRVCLDFQIE